MLSDPFHSHSVFRAVGQRPPRSAFLHLSRLDQRARCERWKKPLRVLCSLRWHETLLAHLEAPLAILRALFLFPSLPPPSVAGEALLLHFRPVGTDSASAARTRRGRLGILRPHFLLRSSFPPRHAIEKRSFAPAHPWQSRSVCKETASAATQGRES